MHRQPHPDATAFHALPRLVAACLAGAVALAAASPALAGGYLKDRIYDDSFGNLIILSPSGYKRIVVGMGYVAAEMQAQDRSQPHVADGDMRRRAITSTATVRACCGTAAATCTDCRRVNCRRRRSSATEPAP